jgi:preprotein translocase subunit SecF
MKKYWCIFLLLLFLGCKSTQEVKKNQLDISKEKIEAIENKIKVTQLTLDEFEITFHTADPKKPVTFTDEKGNTQKFENVKKATLKKKSEQKKDSTVSEKKAVAEKETDNSIIDETNKTVSDAVQYKGMLVAIAFIFLFLLVIYLVYKFKK